jgi:two-component system, LytTR family, response regulator
MSASRPPVRTVIVDDEPFARRRLRAILAKHPRIEVVGEAGNGTAAVTVVKELEPDLLLLDIQMPGRDGFEVLREVARAGRTPVVIFITAHDEHAVRAFDVQALDYVLKPITEDRVMTAVGRAIERLGEHKRADLEHQVGDLLKAVDASRPDARIPVKTERGVKLVPVSEIHWIEANADLVKIHTAREAHVVRMTMAEAEAQVPRARFVRIHRGAIVNVACIQEIQPLFKGDYAIVLKSGVELRSGRTHRANVQALIRR